MNFVPIALAVGLIALATVLVVAEMIRLRAKESSVDSVDSAEGGVAFDEAPEVVAEIVEPMPEIVESADEEFEFEFEDLVATTPTPIEFVAEEVEPQLLSAGLAQRTRKERNPNGGRSEEGSMGMGSNDQARIAAKRDPEKVRASLADYKSGLARGRDDN